MPKALHLMAGSADPPRPRLLRARPGRALSQTGALPDEEDHAGSAAWFAALRVTGLARHEVKDDVAKQFWNRELAARDRLRRVRNPDSVARAQAEIDRIVQEWDAELERCIATRAADPALQERAVLPWKFDTTATRRVTVEYKPASQGTRNASGEAFEFQAVAADGRVLAELQCPCDPQVASAVTDALRALLKRFDPPSAQGVTRHGLRVER